MDHLKIINAFNTTHLKIMIDYKKVYFLKIYYLGAFLKQKESDFMSITQLNP